MWNGYYDGDGEILLVLDDWSFILSDENNHRH